MKKLLLIDGSNIMFRAYYATAYAGNLMQNSKGEYTNAIYGMANMLNALLAEDFTHILVAFDEGKQTFRHKDFEAYKAKRTAMPEEFRAQLPHIREFIDRLGLFQFEHMDYEADDIIGSIAMKYKDTFDAIEIISNDRDFFQLLNNKVSIRLSKRGTQPEQHYTTENLMADFGLSPVQIPDLKGLMGDSSDNLPGVPGVGEKTALKLIHEYGNLEQVLAHLNEITGKLKERLEVHGKQAVLCKKLATIITDADLGINLENIEYKGFNQKALIEFYQRMEFHSLIRRLDNGNAQKEVTTTNLSHLKEETAIHHALIDQTTLILENFGDNYHHAQKLGFALDNTRGSFYITYETAVNSDAFKAFLGDETRAKSTFDLKELKVCLMQDGLDIEGVHFDLLLAAYVLNPSNTKEDFKVIVQNFDYDDVPYLEEVYGKGAKLMIPDEAIVINYAVKKARAVRRLQTKLHNLILKQNQAKLLYEVEIPLALTLADMEFHGIRIDGEALDRLDATLGEEIETITTEIHKMAGQSFNVSSPKQLGEILFDKLKLPSYKKSKTGYSTNIDVLNKLKKKHPIIEKIIRYRSLTKLQSTYVKGLAEAMHKDGKIHTIYKQAFTQTGRLSSIEPNLQNIPIRTELGREIRKVFIPDEANSLVAADYSQIELRVLAHMADETELIRAFEHDEDIHAITAKEIFETDQVTPSQRRIAKAVNFGIIYGQSPWGLSDDLGIPLEEAEIFIARYYRRFFGIAKFMDAIIEQAENEGFVTTLLNRRRYIPEVKSRIYAQRELGKRTAMNAPIQGSAADIIKIAMVEIDRRMHQEGLQSKLVLQIHDELVFSVIKSEEETMIKLIKEVMEDAYPLKVPLTVNLAIGANLDDAK